jgi:hypothetical protein
MIVTPTSFGPQKLVDLHSHSFPVVERPHAILHNQCERVTSTHSAAGRLTNKK